MTRKICLLIDDDPDEREIFEMALSDAGSPVDLVFVIDPSVAVKALKIGLINPDYIFIDINMPKLNGWETLKHLDKIENLAWVPIAMYSTSIPPEMPVVVDNLKAVRMISKTPGISELGGTLHTYFSSH